MCYRVVSTYHSTIEFVPKCYKTQKMRDKSYNSFFCIYILDQYKSQEMCDRVIFENPFMIVYYPNKYKIQRMCDQAVNDCLAALKFLIDLLQVKCFKNLIMLYSLMIIYSF